jgi:hypothetical protein
MKSTDTSTTSSLIDYAHPCMMAENALKKAHKHMLNREYGEAIEQALDAIVETRLMINTIKHMRGDQ